MRYDPADLPEAATAFLSARHLATLTTLRDDGSPHVVAIAFTWEPADRIVRIITNGSSRKVAHVRRGSRAAVCQVDGRYWLTLEGPARVLDDAAAVADAVHRYAKRYREVQPNPQRVVIEIVVDRITGAV